MFRSVAIALPGVCGQPFVHRSVGPCRVVQAVALLPTRGARARARNLKTACSVSIKEQELLAKHILERIVPPLQHIIDRKD